MLGEEYAKPLQMCLLCVLGLILSLSSMFKHVSLEVRPDSDFGFTFRYYNTLCLLLDLSLVAL